MLAFFDPEQLKHEPKFSLFSGAPKQNSEVAERATVLREALQQQGHELKEPEPRVTQFIIISLTARSIIT